MQDAIVFILRCWSFVPLSQDQMWCVDLHLSLYVRLGKKKTQQKETKKQEDDTKVM